MKTVTLSFRVDEPEAQTLERAAKAFGTDRSALLKILLRRGFSLFLFERACDAYRRGEVSLSRAAEMADISYRDMLLRMAGAGVELNYDASALEHDLTVSLPPPRAGRQR